MVIVLMIFVRSYGKAAPLLVLFMLLGQATLWAEPWKFGVMGDTQWTTADPAGENPSTVAVSIIEQVNRQFIDAGVKFVIQVGDLSDDGRELSQEVRAEAARPLIDAGIGFFAVRGNHECKGGKRNGYGATGFRTRFPQSRDGAFMTREGRSYRVGSNFSSPVEISRELDGLSYSFDFGEGKEWVRFVMIDNWPLPGRLISNSTKYPSGYTVADQQAWISERLDLTERGAPHAFVFSHQPVLGQNHQDTLFSGYADEHPEWQNAFFASLNDNGVRYFICGHDHLHQRSIIRSPDGKSQVEQLITASLSSKFYTSKPANHRGWRGQKSRETPVSQELYTVGYYIFTIDGPTVTVEFFADDHGGWNSDEAFPQGTGRPDTGKTPLFRFVLKERWSYTLNGRDFAVSRSASTLE